MYTLGDILFIFMVVTVSGLALWGTLVAASLLFPHRSAKLAQTLERRSWTSLIAGFFVTMPLLILIVVLANVPSPVVKVLSLLLFLAFMAYAIVGASGQVRLLAERVRNTDKGFSMYGSLTRASAILVLAFNIPFVGWLFLAPLSLMAGIGSIVLAKVSKAPEPQAEA